MLKEKVSVNQFFALLYLSLLSTVFMYLSSEHIKIAQTDALLRPVIFVVVSFVVGVPVFLVLKRHTRLTVEHKYIGESAVLRVVAFVYGVVYVIGILKAAARFDLFASSELFPGNDMTVFLVVILCACALMSGLGLGALSRGAGVFAFLVCITTLFVMLSLWSEVDLLNFTPLLENGVGAFLEDGLIFAVQATEIGTIIMVLPDLKGNVKKAYIIWTVLSAVTFSLVLFFVIGSLGAFADTQLFPTYTSVTLASFGLLERIDALETAIWILCIIEKISFYFLVAIKAFSYAVGCASRRTITFILCAVVCVVVVLVSYNIEHFAFLSADVLSVVLFLVAVVVLPWVAYFYIKRVKPCDKIPENI